MVTRRLAILFSLGLLWPGAVQAQFTSGSTGANGALPPVAIPAGTTDIWLDLRDGTLRFEPGGDLASIPSTPADGFVDGVLNLTSVDVPADVTLRFQRNEANSPVTLLVQGDVSVAGTISVDGEPGSDSAGPGQGRGGFGGPGGFKGGSGQFVFGTARAGTGLGAGGGTGAGGGGTGAGGGVVDSNGSGGGGGGFGSSGANGQDAPGLGGVQHGTPQLLPMHGGSGGGGGSAATNDGPAGGGAGGGGGALLIASSTVIDVSGVITARGGAGGVPQVSGNCGGGGGGSGGAIRLIADRISGAGSIVAAGGVGGAGNQRNGGQGGLGYVRLEAAQNVFSGAVTGRQTSGSPGFVFLPGMPSVRIDAIDGQMAPPLPQGAVGGMDLVVDQPGLVNVDLGASRVPLGTTIVVVVKPEQDGGVTSATSGALVGTFEASTASAQVDLPSAGLYFVEARATFELP